VDQGRKWNLEADVQGGEGVKIALPVIAKCPATFCPLFASKGSPWTGDKNADCEKDACGFWNKDKCTGWELSFEPIMEVIMDVGEKVVAQKPPCKFEDVCQWQRQLGKQVCPPRFAMMHGLDPTLARW
jgi:hypothetical protein